MSIADVTIQLTTRKRRSPEEFLRTKWREAIGAPRSTSVIPYPGLRSFNVNEAHIFRARNNQIKALRNAFAGASPTDEARHVTMVVGGSSSGKSSIVKAGLLADIHSLHMPDGGGNWYVAECRPVQAPMQELLSGLATMIVNAIFTELQGDDVGLTEKWEQALGAIGATEFASPVPHDNLSENATRRVRALLDARLWSTRHQLNPDAVAPALTLFVRETLNRLDLHLHPLRAGPPRLLVSIDQFEEIFRCADNAEKAALFDLVRFIDQAKVQGARELYLVASMRSEELHRCSELKGISDIVNRSVHLVELVSRDDVKKAIIEPGRMTLQACGFPLNEDSNWPYTQGSVDAMAAAYDAFASAKIDYRADALPLLQHLLRLLWGRSVGAWVEEANSSPLLIAIASLSALPGWDEPRSSATSKSRESGDDVGEAQSRLARVLNFSADAVFQRAIEAWCKTVGDSSEPTRALARTVLKASFVSMVRQDDRRKVVREWQTLDGMLASSSALEKHTTEESDDKSWHMSRVALFEQPLAAALQEFENATLIERRADAGSRDDRKLPDKYTVYHESFIRNWRQYANWVREAGKASATLHAIYKEVCDTTTALAAEEIVTAGREADLSVVVGALDDDNSPNPQPVEPVASERGTFSQNGWASKVWMLTEISRVEIPGAPFDAQGFLAELHELRSRAIDARKNKSELEAETARAKAEAAEAKAKTAEAERKRARKWIPIAALASCLLTVSLVAVFYFLQNQENRFRHRISGLGLVGLEATEVPVGTLRQIYQDRDLWLVLNALEDDRSDSDFADERESLWPQITYPVRQISAVLTELSLALTGREHDASSQWSEASKEIQNERGYMRGQIAHRARQVLADLTYVEDKSTFIGAAEAKETKCLRQSLEEAPINGPGEPEGPSKMWFRIANGELQYTTDRAADFLPITELNGISPLYAICISPASEALLLISERDNQPRPFVVLTQWNRRISGGVSQWFLQILAVRALQSWSSSALYAKNPIELSAIQKTMYLNHESVVGFVVPVHSGGGAAIGQQMGVLWTNQGFSATVVDPTAFKSLDPIAPVCEYKGNDRNFCRITKTMPSGDKVVAEYNRFSGRLLKACVDESEFCQATISILREDGRILKFNYQGRAPTGLNLNHEYLSVQGDDGIVRKFDLRQKTVKDLVALRWRHLTCRLGHDTLGEVTSATSIDARRALGIYQQPELPKYPDDRDCLDVPKGVNQ
ncbi:nSTAND1 domain-containing NTPase [Rhizobium leguminosarum]